MAFPYMLLSTFPSLLRFMPKPGNWMVTFKEATGFLMMAVVLWLLWIFSAQTDSLSLFILLFGFLVISLGCWIYGKWATPVKSKRTRFIATLATLACIAFGANMAYTASTAPITTLNDRNPLSLGDYHQTEAWVDFDADALEQLQKKGIPV